MFRFIGVALLALPGFAAGIIAYEQPSIWQKNGDPIGGWSAAYLGVGQTGLVALDQFSFASGQTIFDVRWRFVNLKSDLTDGPLSNGYWLLDLFSDNGGAPGALLSSHFWATNTDTLGTGDLNGNPVTIYETGIHLYTGPPIGGVRFEPGIYWNHHSLSERHVPFRARFATAARRDRPAA